MNIKGFFTTALGSALELEIGTSEDVLRHVTPDVLATYLPRPLWARLLTACLGASRVDATVVVETIGVANICEHIPAPIIWACLAEIGARSLGGVVSAPPRAPFSVGLSPPPPPIVAAPPPAAAHSAAHSAEPLAAIVAELEAEDRAAPAAPLRPRTGTRPPFRQAATGIGRLTGTKRPQAAASADNHNGDGSPARTPRRGQTEADSFELETDVRHEPLPVDDEQLVDWSSSEETAIGGDLDRKR